MKFSALMAFVCAGALALAGSPSYNVTFFMPSEIAGKQLRAGDYKIEIQGDKALVGYGKNRVETPVKIEQANEKFATTSVRYQNVDGKAKVEQIRVGGTNTVLVFGERSGSSAAVNE